MKKYYEIVARFYTEDDALTAADMLYREFNDHEIIVVSSVMEKEALSI